MLNLSRASLVRPGSFFSPSTDFDSDPENRCKTMPEQTPSPQLPSESVRTFVSLLLIVHLFAIGIAFFAYPSTSLLEGRIVRTLGPYLRTFNFDLAHVYPTAARPFLTHAGPTDIDYTVTGTVRLPDRTTVEWQLPRKGLFPLVRTQRDQALANTAGSLTDSQMEDMEVILPGALATAELQRNNAKSGTVKVTAHYLQEIQAIGGSEVNRRNPNDPSYFRDAFEATVLLGPSGVDVLKKAAAGEVAPLTGSSGTAAPPTNRKESP